MIPENKKIVVLYWSDDWAKKVPISSEPTREAFEEMHKEGLSFGIEFYRASIKWLDESIGVFTRAWCFRDGVWVKIEEPLKPDMILDKLKGKRDFETFDLKMKISEKIKIYNSPIFRSNFDNKFTQYLILGEFMPKTLLVEDGNHFLNSLKMIRTSDVVVKPVYGSGGFGICIDKKEKVSIPKEGYPYIIQEFIQGSGIPGFSNSRELADLRLIYINGKMLYALSRIAKSGSLFTNFHQGATPVLVPGDKIPKSAMNMANKINKKMGLFKGANYSLDFIFDEKGHPLLVEVNTTPGFDLLQIVGGVTLTKKYLKELKEVING